MSLAKRRDGTPVWVEASRSEPLERIELRSTEGGYDEAWLQRLIHSHPSALPVSQIETGFGRPTAVCRELPLVFGAGRTGALDNVFVTDTGGLILVETKLKLWRNPEARRTVVAQAMEYAATVFRMTFDDSAVVFRTRDMLVRQRTQLINALRGHLTEFGYVVRQGVGHVSKLIEIVGDPASNVPVVARPILAVITDSLQSLQSQIALLDREIAGRAKADPVAKRLMTSPGVGPVTATALVALAPAASTFRRGRDFAAWLGLVPRQHSSGGKERLGRTTRMGERSLRRLLILGASSATKVAARNPGKASAWLAGMLTRKPRMLVTVALANKIARTVWALMAHGGSYRAPAAAV